METVSRASLPDDVEALLELLDSVARKVMELTAVELEDKDIRASSGCRALARLDAGDTEYLIVRVPRRTGERLTGREWEVVGLAVQGLHNGQIATELGIKRATVSSHLRSVYRKLDVKSRVELCALYAQQLWS